MVVTMYTDFYNDCKNSRAIIGYFLLSISGQTQIYSLCDNDAISRIFVSFSSCVLT